jgi:hypothetical protein
MEGAMWGAVGWRQLSEHGICFLLFNTLLPERPPRAKPCQYYDKKRVAAQKQQKTVDASKQV